jgi:hypothetical protein
MPVGVATLGEPDVPPMVVLLREAAVAASDEHYCLT